MRHINDKPFIKQIKRQKTKEQKDKRTKER